MPLKLIKIFININFKHTDIFIPVYKQHNTHLNANVVVALLQLQKKQRVAYKIISLQKKVKLSVLNKRKRNHKKNMNMTWPRLVYTITQN